MLTPYLMGCPGFEPGTSRLKAECSTTELATPVCAFLTCVCKYSTDSEELGNPLRIMDSIKPESTLATASQPTIAQTSHRLQQCVERDDVSPRRLLRDCRTRCHLPIVRCALPSPAQKFDDGANQSESDHLSRPS